jgi:hypothetical protein
VLARQRVAYLRVRVNEKLRAADPVRHDAGAQPTWKWDTNKALTIQKGFSEGSLKFKRDL